MDHHEHDARADLELQLLQEFVNTNDVQSQHDEIGTPEQFGAWLTDNVPGGVGVQRIDRETHRQALVIREGLRVLGRANNGESVDGEVLRELNQAAARLPVAIRLDSDRWQLAPTGRGAEAFLGRILSTLVQAMADGRWSRVKSCRNDTCQWLFIDRSRNRSATWCSMAGCGSRMKARTYRARRRDSGGA
jgi:predicted RNA-binding Zn ribbon-like protein